MHEENNQETTKNLDDFYVQAWDEINDQNSIPNKSLWAKAFAVAQGDEKKTQAKYIEFRVAQLQDEYEQKQKLAFLEAEKKAKIESLEAERKASIEALEAKRKAYKVSLQSKNSFDSLRPLAKKIKEEGINADARDLIEKLGGVFDPHKSKNQKWIIAVSLGGEKHTFSDFDECIDWLNINIIPLILETDCVHQRTELKNLGLSLSNAEDCIKILRSIGFVVSESEKGKWLITSPLNSVIIHAHSIGDLHRIINEHYASKISSEASSNIANPTISSHVPSPPSTEEAKTLITKNNVERIQQNKHAEPRIEEKTNEKNSVGVLNYVNFDEKSPFSTQTEKRGNTNLMHQNQNSRPEKVTNAVKLLYISLGIGILQSIIQASSMFVKLSTWAQLVSMMFIMFSVLGIIWFLIHMIGKGHNWARITYLVLCMIGIPFTISFLLKSMASHPILGLLGIGQTVIQILALVFLFQKPSSIWFREVKAQRRLTE